MGPELGITLPDMTIVCGDSHTATHGAFGSLAFGIGTSEVEPVLATQTLKQGRAKTMKIEVRGKVAPASPLKTSYWRSLVKQLPLAVQAMSKNFVEKRFAIFPWKVA